MLCKPKNNSGKDAGTMVRLVKVKIQQKSGCLIVNIGLLEGQRFYIKKIDVLCKLKQCC